jgi:hypothetical protein
LYVYNVAGWSHSKKQVRDALDEAYAAGFAIRATPAGHRWGYVECGKCGQTFSVWSTPRNPDNHQANEERRALSAMAVESLRIFCTADRVLAARDALKSEPDDDVREEFERLFEDA